MRPIVRCDFNNWRAPGLFLLSDHDVVDDIHGAPVAISEGALLTVVDEDLDDQEEAGFMAFDGVVVPTVPMPGRRSCKWSIRVDGEDYWLSEHSLLGGRR